MLRFLGPIQTLKPVLNIDHFFNRQADSAGSIVISTNLTGTAFFERKCGLS